MTSEAEVSFQFLAGQKSLCKYKQQGTGIREAPCDVLVGKKTDGSIFGKIISHEGKLVFTEGGT